MKSKLEKQEALMGVSSREQCGERAPFEGGPARSNAKQIGRQRDRRQPVTARGGRLHENAGKIIIIIPSD